MPDDLAEPVVSAASFFCCWRAMGEAFTRDSLRPLDVGRDMLSHHSGATARRERGLIFPRGCLKFESETITVRSPPIACGSGLRELGRRLPARSPCAKMGQMAGDVSDRHAARTQRARPRPRPCLADHSPIFFFRAPQVDRTSSVSTEQDSMSLKMRCASLRK